MRILDKKRILAIIGLTVILFSFLLISPQKAKAMVPTIDAAAITELTAANTLLGTISFETGSLVSKEFGLDMIAYTAAKTLLHALTQSVVQWIKSGFQGDPLFITNMDQYLRDAADQGTGRFFKEFFSPAVQNAICRPFRMQINFGLPRGRSYNQRFQCTLSTVMQNAENFGKSLNEGSWQDWMSVALTPQNDPHTVLLTSVDALFAEQDRTRANAQTESMFNSGFLSMKKCVEEYADEWTGGAICTRYENTTPGAWISDQLSSATGIDFQELALADELNEIVSALISQLISTTLQQGFK